MVFAPHLGGAEKKIFRYANLPPYLYLTPPTFQILKISLKPIQVFSSFMKSAEYDSTRIFSDTCIGSLRTLYLTRSNFWMQSQSALSGIRICGGSELSNRPSTSNHQTVANNSVAVVKTFCEQSRSMKPCIIVGFALFLV